MNVNDLGLGTCPLCKQWKLLPTFHPKDAKLPRKQRRRICTSCDQKHKRSTVPFFAVNKLISSHKHLAKEGDYSKDDLMKLHATQGGMCAYCRTAIPYEFSIEHIIPRKFEGRNLLFNILLICPTCNSGKQHFELAYWLQKKGYKLNERIHLRVRKSYDQHGYECKIDCSLCLGTTRKERANCSKCEAGSSTGSTGSSTGSTSR